MNTKANYIKQRLSLREPLQKSLDIIAELSDILTLQKGANLRVELEKIHKRFRSCTDFERDFPSLCFSIATGVGKTRLMGACITYLYLEKGIRNFFVLAPNLTIYDKLIEDFGNPGFHKYVFNGISEFVHNRPLIITGDNYNQQGGLFSDSEIRINIFNIAKFNSESKVTKKDGRSVLPRIKRLSEYLGQSYWEYLSGLDDLVILMDEAHRYHADSSRNAINELQPILGIELTATPIDEKGRPFKNVVYEYTLAQALADGKYVKKPAIATRKDFTTQGLDQADIDNIKLEDAISIHEDTRTELELYAYNNGLSKVKPFILVVCSDIKHARDTFEYISSDQFYNGKYRGKVLQIDSSTKKDEEIEKQFLSLEREDNTIEIVIHVNMLKEGWDVTNLYTIVPLRAAKAAVLIEQTIGRGLRLPYNGERTGVDKVDKLTVVTHDNFEKVIEAAQDPQSILNKFSHVILDEETQHLQTTIVTSTSKVQVDIQHEAMKIAGMVDGREKQEAQNTLDAKKAIINILSTFTVSDGVTSGADLSKPEIKQKAMEKVRQNLQLEPNLFQEHVIAEAQAIYEPVVESFRKNIIEIPRMDLVQEEAQAWFIDFDLDTMTGFDLPAMREEIIIMELQGMKVDNIGVQYGALSKESPLNQLMSELINFPEIDYDNNTYLLNKLVHQAVVAIEQNLEDSSSLLVVIKQYKKIIARRIYEQLVAHFIVSEPVYTEPHVLLFEKIEDHNFSALVTGGYKDYRDAIPASAISRYVFTGFEKACHLHYKFDSTTERDFAFILETDRSVVKWLRPALKQFRIYWAENRHQYHPDFIVETSDTIYMVETKAASNIGTQEVLDKKKAALHYCKYASTFTVAHGGKPWKYVLIPHTAVTRTAGFEYLVHNYVQE